jgi:hypothetical protein
MANVNAPFGLRPVRHAHGAPYNGAFKEYFATGATGAIYVGDPVVLAGSANTTEIQGRAAGTLPTVTVAADGDGDPIHGVCVGVAPVTADSLTYRADSTDRIIQVADDPNLVFQVQCDGASTDWAATDVGSYANLLVGTGSTVTGMSGWTADTTDGPDTADVSNQLLIVGLAKIPGNVIGEFAVWEVMINNHGFAVTTGDPGRLHGV